MAFIEPPFWYLDPESLASGEGAGMLLQDTDLIPPVLPVEVGAQAIPRVGGPRASGEGAGSSLRCPQESHIVYLGLVYCLNGNRLQSMAGSVLCMRRRCDVMEPAVSSTPHSCDFSVQCFWKKPPQMPVYLWVSFHPVSVHPCFYFLHPMLYTTNLKYGTG